MSSIEKLWKRGTDFLGSDYAIMGGAMSWISESNLVAALSNAGVFGVIATGAMPPDMLRTEIRKTKTKTNKPFGVNLIVMHPDLTELINVCIEEEVTHIIFAGGFPKKHDLDPVKERGIKTIGFAPNVPIAKRLLRNGIDALVLEGSEAGGHIGPITTSVLIQEVLPEIKDGIVFIAGGVARGDTAVSYLEMGAAGVQMGTLFVCTNECIAHDNFKQAFIKASARDAGVSVQLNKEFPIIPVRALSNKGTNEFLDYQRYIIDQYNEGKVNKQDAQLNIEKYWAGALRKAVIDGDTERGSLMAGQCVGIVKEIKSVKEVINDFIEQAENYLQHKQ